jgi:hypothetical protein
MSKSEIAVVVMGYLVIIIIGHKAETESKQTQRSEVWLEFLSFWTASSIMCWGMQWLLTWLILDHPSPHVILWSIVAGFLGAGIIQASPEYQRQIAAKPGGDLPSVEIKTSVNERESSTGSVGA